MSRRRRFLYILLTVLLCWVISYVCYTGCNLPGLPDVPAEEPETETEAEEPSTGGDSP